MQKLMGVLCQREYLYVMDQILSEDCQLLTGSAIKRLHHSQTVCIAIGNIFRVAKRRGAQGRKSKYSRGPRKSVPYPLLATLSIFSGTENIYDIATQTLFSAPSAPVKKIHKYSV